MQIVNANAVVVVVERRCFLRSIRLMSRLQYGGIEKVE